MNKNILITDSLFIFPEHEKVLIDAGYSIERLDKVEATETELTEAIKGKVGYILGGTEKLTNTSIDSADELKAIVFTGIGYKDFIPNYEYVLGKGIMIANTPDSPTHAVAEWAMTMALAMNRNIFELGRAGEKKFMTSKGLEGGQVGIIGLGRIGREITTMLKPFRPASISYYSQHRHESTEQELDIQYKEFDTLLAESDVIFLAVSKDAGKNFFGKEQITKMKDGALLVSFMHRGIVDEIALLDELKTGRVCAVSDYLFDEQGYTDLPLGTWYCFNGSNAFNTFAELKLTSDMAVRSLLNLLETGNDENKVTK